MNWINRNLMALWFILTLFLCWEYAALHWAIKYSTFNYIKVHHWPAFNTSPDAGRPISYFFGWAGFLIMCLTNIYVLRKRFGLFSNWGRSRNWLEFHIFCGLLGPTLIVFHSNFEVHGLVAISFWSMMIVAGSGVLGRYFYLQAAKDNQSLKLDIEKWEKRINKLIEMSGKQVEPERVAKMKEASLRYVGAVALKEYEEPPSLLQIILKSIRGDIRLMMGSPRVLAGLHPQAPQVLCSYALAVRKENYLSQFERLLGYWHSFHVPFAIIMYITAIIHIVVASIFLIR